jgi:hypothetical protein
MSDEKCIKNVSVTGERCSFPAKMFEDRMIYMCDNRDYTHFFTHQELVEFES